MYHLCINPLRGNPGRQPEKNPPSHLIMAHIAKKHILHIAVVHMAATDESCSSTTLYMSKELDKTSPEAAANSCNKPKAGHNDRATVPSAVNTVPKLKRAKFEPKRRQQVANVRKKGACMRCRIKKLPVSAGVCFRPL